MDYENIRQELINIVRKYKRFARCDFEDLVQEGFICYFESNGDLEVVEKNIKKFCNSTRNEVCTLQFPDFKFHIEKQTDQDSLIKKDYSDITDCLRLVKEISPISEELIRYRYGIMTEPLTWDQLSTKLNLSPSRLRILFYRSLRLLRRVAADFEFKPKFGPDGLRWSGIFQRIQTIQGELLQYLFWKQEPLPLYDIAKDFYPVNETSIKYYLEDLIFKKTIFSGKIYIERTLRSYNGFIRKRKYLNKVYSINPVQSNVELKHG